MLIIELTLLFLFQLKMDSKLTDDISNEIVNLINESGINAETKDGTLSLKFKDHFRIEAQNWNEY